MTNEQVNEFIDDYCTMMVDGWRIYTITAMVVFSLLSYALAAPFPLWHAVATVCVSPLIGVILHRMGWVEQPNILPLNKGDDE